MENKNSIIHLVRLVFKERILTLSGSAFEDFAISLLRLKYPNLQKTKPDGPEGDWATDAICMEDGIFFQIYAPEYKDKNSLLTDSKRKLERDFKRLFSKWREAGLQVNEWYFVLNEKYQGAYPVLIKKTNEIKIENNLKRTGLILSSKLEDIVLDLYRESPLDVELLLNNPVLSIDEDVLTRFNCFEPLYEVCEYIANNDENDGFEFLENEVPLEDEEKIDRNQLYLTIKYYILTALDKVELVNRFFASNSNFISEEIRKKVVKAYKKTAKEISDPNLVFIKLLEELSGNWKNRRDLNSSLVILVSFYFQLCDIFKR
jgi:hypothetical protein